MKRRVEVRNKFNRNLNGMGVVIINFKGI